MPPTLPTSAVRELSEKLGHLQGRARAAAKRDFVSLYQVSDSTLSRALHQVGFVSHTRSDRGVRRKPISDDHMRLIAALQSSGNNLRRGIIMPAKDAIDVAHHNGLIPEAVDPNYYNAWLREQGGTRVDQQAATPHIELRSAGPNHVHQADFSLAVNWKVANNKPIYERFVYKNKDLLKDPGEQRIWRLLIVDHATGCFFPFYGISPGESIALTLEGLYRAWSPKSIGGQSIQDRFPFRGVPRILMVDRGSANRAGVTLALLNRLNVQLNICEGARSKGAVEVSHRYWEERFESRFRIQPPQSIEQLNDWAVDFAARICGAETHSRHGSKRSLLWSWHINRKPETQLRELRCDFETFKAIAVTDPVEARVSGSRIVRFKGKKYRAPEAIQCGSTVAIQYSPFDYPQIQMRDAANANAPLYICTPVELDEFGFAASAALVGEEYKAQKHTATQHFAAQAKETVSALLSTNMEAFGYHSDRAPAIPIQSASEAVQIDGVTPAAPLTRIQARTEVMAILGRAMTAAEADYVNRHFGEQVTEEHIAAVVTAIQQGIGATILPFASGARK